MESVLGQADCAGRSLGRTMVNINTKVRLILRTVSIFLMLASLGWAGYALAARSIIEIIAALISANLFLSALSYLERK